MLLFGVRHIWLLVVSVVRRLPAVEAVAPGALTTTHGESDKPQDQQDDRSDPQDMEGKPGTEEDQDEQQREYEQHETTHLSVCFQDAPGIRGQRM
jgi:hypothetical protein